MTVDDPIRSRARFAAVVLLTTASALFASAAQAGSPLTLSILQDAGMQVTQLDVSYARRVKCEKPDFPPSIEIVTEKGVLELAGKKSFYISELRLDEPSQEICFMPERTVTVTTGGDIAGEQVIPAQTWKQISQALDIQRVTAVVGKGRVAVDPACLGYAKLDAGEGHQTLTFRQVGNLVRKSKSGKASKPGMGGETPVRIECEVGP